jgi:hypothetical protein
MLFCQLGRADSLREICNGLGCCLGKLVHVGILRAPKKSTLSYANEHRPAALFEDLFWSTLKLFREQQGLGPRPHKFRFKNKLLSLDSTTISLCLALFPWAKFRRAKGGVKAHVLLDHDDYMPSYVLLTEARKCDVKVAYSFTLNPGSIVAMDRGYTDYGLFAHWTEAGVFFVTRLREDARYEIMEERAIPAQRNIRADQLIRLTSELAQGKCPCVLRRVVVWDAVNQREIVLLTNLLEFGATTISAIYRERWQIELFFKALKQNLTVKTFVGTSENALRIQIWTALITLLLLKWLLMWLGIDIGTGLVRARSWWTRAQAARLPPRSRGCLYGTRLMKRCAWSARCGPSSAPRTGGTPPSRHPRRARRSRSSGSEVKGIGLSGQMHGLVILDRAAR